MDAGQVLIVSGPPGAGKTSVARSVAEGFDRAVCLEADWFWTTIVSGYIEPWQPESADQNQAVLTAVGAAAAALARGGYQVVIDGIVGPWLLPTVVDQCRRTGVEAHYVVLRPTLEVAVARATSRVGDERVPGHPALTDEEPIRHMWHQFADLGHYESSVIDNSGLIPVQTAGVVLACLLNGSHQL